MSAARGDGGGEGATGRGGGGEGGEQETARRAGPKHVREVARIAIDASAVGSRGNDDSN